MLRATCLASLLALLLGGDAGRPKQNPRVTALFVRSQWNSGWFRASGVWKEKGTSLPPGESQAVDLNCYRNLKICVEATATLSSGALAARTELYDIEVWDEKQIRTARAPEPCGYFVLTIDRDPPKVYANKVNDQTRNSTCTTPGVVETIELDCVALGSVL